MLQRHLKLCKFVVTLITFLFELLVDVLLLALLFHLSEVSELDLVVSAGSAATVI